MEPSQIFDDMDKEKSGLLCLDDLEGCLDKVPNKFLAYVKQVLVNYIFTEKSFEITKEKFLSLIEKEHKTPMHVRIDLQVLLGKDSAKKPSVFSLRLMKRLKEKQNANASLRKILDESEEFCEK